MVKLRGGQGPYKPIARKPDLNYYENYAEIKKRKKIGHEIFQRNPMKRMKLHESEVKND
jgi:hypothetical protein